ncbi:MAG: prepilin peptidase [Bacilli bacterium]|nr:prepilin peptidase [Bacilli bacterium]
MYIYLLLFFILGVLSSYFIELLGYRLPLGESVFKKNTCDTCSHELKLYETLPIISFIIQKGRCNYCHQKLSKLYIFFEIMTGVVFSLTYLTFYDDGILKLIFGLLFITSLVIVCFSDFKYMIISDEILIVFSTIIVLLKIFIEYKNEEILSLMDLGYSLIDIVIDAVVVYLIMFAIKKIGDLIFKKESLGYGDLKLMAYIALVLGIKLSIVTIFIASFIALPFAIITNLKKDKLMLPFGPFLAIGAMILFLSKVDFNSLLELLH